MSNIIDKIRAKVEQQNQVIQAVVQDSSKIAAAVEKIRAAGFSIQLQPGDKLLVTPRSKLTEKQVEWISAHKLEILTYLRSLPDAAVQALQATFQAKVEQIILPSPLPVEEPPKPTGPVLIRCLDCLHGTRALPGDELGAWRNCEMGYGGYFALKRRLCDGYAAKP